MDQFTQGNKFFNRLSALSLGLLFLVSEVSFAALTITLSPGDNLQSAVDSNPAGTVFVLNPGTYRNQMVSPKEGNKFIGRPGAVINGARVLTSFTREGNYWVATGQTQRGQVHGECLWGYEGCRFPEDLFIDNLPLWQVTSRSEVKPGKWFFDYDANKIYMADNPEGRIIETSITRHAFTNSANNIVIEGLTIEKYANPAQFGAIHGDNTKNWIVKNNEVRLNHGVGIRMGDRWLIENNHVYRNGQLGIGGRGDNVKVIGNEISYNNYAGFSWGWEAGGTKFVYSNNLLVRGNKVHHNEGPGLWTDIDNINVIYEYNVVTDNAWMGIFHEISYDAIIRNNTVEKNGKSHDVWLWGAQILLAGSQNVEVYGNHVVVDADGGNGIGIVQQNRGHGAYGPWQTINNYVHHNTVIYLGNRGMSGAAADWDQQTLLNGTNRFDNNVYCAPQSDRSHWQWQRIKNWDGFLAAGQEASGAAYAVDSPECTQ